MMRFWKGPNNITRLQNLPEVTVQAKEKIKMRDGDAILVMVNNGELAHFSWNMSLPHVEFVKRTAGELPSGAWVGTVSKLDGQVAAMSSKYFFGYQLPAPPEVADVIQRNFE